MPILRARVDEELKTAVSDYCTRQGQREGEVIRALLRRAIQPTGSGRHSDGESQSEPASEESPAEQLERASQVLSVAVTPSEKRAIAAQARSEGMRPSRWVVWLARRYLSDKPHFNPQELQALREASAKLELALARLSDARRDVEGENKVEVVQGQIDQIAERVQNLRLELALHIDRSLLRWRV